MFRFLCTVNASYFVLFSALIPKRKRGEAFCGRARSFCVSVAQAMFDGDDMEDRLLVGVDGVGNWKAVVESDAS